MASPDSPAPDSPRPGAVRRWLQRKRTNTLRHFGVPALVGFGRITLLLVKGIVRPRARHQETYADAVARLHLDSERLRASYRYHAQIAYGFGAFALASWTIAVIDLTHVAVFAFLPALTIGTVFLVLAAHASWSCMRLQQRRLLPIWAWLRDSRFWFPGPYRP